MRLFLTKALSTMGIFLCVAAMGIFISCVAFADDKAKTADSEKSPASKPAVAKTKQPGGKIRLQLQWYPQAQFAGYIMALEKGFFKQQGLDVELVWPGFGYQPIENLDAGKVDFCTAWLSDAIYKKQKGKNVCLLAQLMPKSSMMIVAKKSSGIKKPQDLDGKKVGLWIGEFKIAPTAFFKKYGIEPICITQTPSILPFLCGAVDAASAMYYNEYHKLFEAGLKKDELVTFSLANEGLNVPEDGVYCRVDYREANPEICEKMLKAIKQGWEYSFANKGETLEVLVEYCRNKIVCTNINHQRWMLNTIEGLIPMTETPSKPWGYLDENTYDKVIQILLDQKQITKAPAYSDIYRPVGIQNNNSKEADK